MADDYTPLGFWIGGAFRSDAPQHLEVINPATAKTIGRLPLIDATLLDEVLAAAEKGFAAWRKVSPYDRAKVMKRAADLIRERAPAIARVCTLEQGKPLAEAQGEVLYAADVIEWYAEEGRRTYGRVIPGRDAAILHHVVQEPVGVAAAFTPWNFPALTPARKIGGALAAGCSLILKAAEETPGTAVELVRAFVDAGLPAGALNLVFGAPAEVSAHLIASPLVRKVSFTGSTAVGRHLMGLCAQGLKRTTMELGGHAPVVVFDDVDVQRTAELLVAAKYRNAGQICISPTHFLVQEGVEPHFVRAFAESAGRLNVGDGVETATQMGPLANPRRVEAMERLVADACDRGATLRAGGKRIGNQGYFFEPTVISGIGEDAAAMNEEPFGPLALVSTFTDAEDALRKANRLPYGLAAYAFSGSTERAMGAAYGIKAGMVGVNSMAVSLPETPFGGVGDSGQGQEGGIEGLSAYLDVKLVALGRAV